MKVQISVDRTGPAGDVTITANVLLRFRSDRRWIDVKHFAIRAGASDDDLLSALVNHRQFRDAYIGAGPRDDEVHGPYHLAAVTPDRFERLDASAAVAWLDDFCTLFDVSPSNSLAHDIDAVVRERVLQPTTVFRLPSLAGAEHELGSILEEFRELVVIHRDSAELSLIVMGID